MPINAHNTREHHTLTCEDLFLSLSLSVGLGAWTVLCCMRAHYGLNATEHLDTKLPCKHAHVSQVNTHTHTCTCTTLHVSVNMCWLAVGERPNETPLHF